MTALVVIAVVAAGYTVTLRLAAIVEELNRPGGPQC